MRLRQSPSGPVVNLPGGPPPTANGNSGAAKTIDFSTGGIQKLTLTANCTLAMVGVTAGESTKAFLELTQDGTGNRTVTLNNTITPGAAGLTLSAGAGATDLIQLLWDGAQWWAWFAGKAFG